MLFFLVTALTVLTLVVDGAVGQCSTFQTQINVSMCNWQGLRGEHSFQVLLRVLPFALSSSADSRSHCLARYVVSGWRESLVYTVRGDHLCSRFALTGSEDTTMAVRLLCQIKVCQPGRISDIGKLISPRINRQSLLPQPFHSLQHELGFHDNSQQYVHRRRRCQ